MFKAAFKNLIAHKLRMFLTGFAIILGVSFVAGTYMFTDSIGKTFDNLFSDVFSGIDLTVRPASTDFGSGLETVPAELLDSISETEGVAVYEAEANGFAQIIGKDGEPIGGQGPPTLGFSWGEESGLNVLHIDESNGRAPEGPGEVVIDIATAEANGFSVGDRISILTDQPVEEFELVGLASFGEANGLAGATLSVFELTEAQRLFGLEQNEYSAINIKATTGVSATELKGNIDPFLPDGVESITGEAQANEQLDDINQGLGFINTALLAFAGVAIFVGSFIIQNTFRIIVTQRSKELALLRAIGATRRQVVMIVVYEAVMIAIVASVLGILLGIAISYGVRGLLNAADLSLPPGPFTLELRTIVVSMSVGVIVTVFAALLPAIKASRVAPVEAMRDTEASGSSRKSLLRRGLLGTALVLIGAGAIILGLNRDGLSNPVYYVGGGAAAMFLGVSTVAPVIARPLAVAIGAPFAWARGMAARLSVGNVKRTPRRTASSAAALMIGVSLVVFVSVLASSFKSTIKDVIRDSFPADIAFISQNVGDAGPGTGGFSYQLIEDLRSKLELTDVTSFVYEFDGAKLDGDLINLAAVDANTFDNVVRLNPDEGALERVRNGDILIFKDEADKNGWQTGDELPIEYALTGEQTVRVAGIFTEPYDTDYIIDRSIYLENFDTETVTFAAANAAEGVDAAAAKQAAEDAVSGYPSVDAQDQLELVEEAEMQIDQLLGLFQGLLGFAIIIAVLGITNTLMLSISERTKEIGMLRAIGMTRKQVRLMVRVESIIIALFGALLGVAMGIFFAWAVLKALESEGITGFVLPYGEIVMYFVIAGIAGVLAAAWPARRASRMNVLDAISHE